MKERIITKLQSSPLDVLYPRISECKVSYSWV